MGEPQSRRLNVACNRCVENVRPDEIASCRCAGSNPPAGEGYLVSSREGQL